MTIDLCFQLHDCTNFFSILLVYHCKGFRNLSHIHLVHNFGNVLWKILHLELRSSNTRVLINIHHDTMVVTGILIL